MRFRRRRCPECFTGTYSSTVDIPATHRKCSSCGHVFNLKAEGVLPDDVPTRRQVKEAPSSSEPIAGGAYAIAGTIEVGRNAKWRIGRGW